jgi:Flp pilus assembly protein TadD
MADQLNLNDALTEFSEAVRLAPNSAVAHYNKGRVLLDLRRNDEAKPELEAATHLDPKSTESWYLLGLIARQSGDTDEAIGQFSQAVALKPDYADARYMLGRELLHKGDSAGAIVQWRKAIEIQPDYGEALYNLARLLAKSDPEDAKRLQTRFDRLQTQKHIMDRAQTLGNFALASADAHDWPQAIAQLKEGIDLCKNCSALPLLHKDLGLIYCRSGELKNGRAELLAAQKLSPADPDVVRALKILDSVQK